jgi:hypothetical protein
MTLLSQLFANLDFRIFSKMEQFEFSKEQLAAIDKLSEALRQCEQLNIHIAGITRFEVEVFKDANGKDYAAIS